MNQVTRRETIECLAMGGLSGLADVLSCGARLSGADNE